MPFTSEEKQVSLNSIGIKLGEKPEALPHKPLSNPDNIRRQIIKDELGFYNLPLNFEGTGEIFDGDNKILSWQCSLDDNVILDIYCSEQVNLWGQAHANNLFINAKGPLLMGDKITCNQSLIVKAQSLAFNQAVHCEQNLVLETDHGVGFLNSVYCNKCIAKTGAMYQWAGFEAKEQADFTCNLYVSNHDDYFISPVLRLVAEHSLLGSHSTVSQKCFLVSNSLYLGRQGQDINITLSGEHHIKVNYLYGINDAKIVVQSRDKESNFQINRNLSIDSNAVFELDKTNLYFNTAILLPRHVNIDKYM